MISGIITAFLLTAFIGIAIWAWSSHNRERWNRAAELPLLEDDDNRAPPASRPGKGEGS